MKDHMNFKLQAENIKEVSGIIGDMIKETDWKEVGKHIKSDFNATKKRLKKEIASIKKDWQLELCGSFGENGKESTQ